jgi:hypothetical protein
LLKTSAASAAVSSFIYRYSMFTVTGVTTFLAVALKIQMYRHS